MLCLSVSRLWVGPGAVSSCLSGFYRVSVCCALQLCQSSESCPAPIRRQHRYRDRRPGPVHVWLDFSQSLRSRNHTPPIRSEESSLSFFLRTTFQVSCGIQMWFNTPSVTFSHIAASSWFSFGNCSEKQRKKNFKTLVTTATTGFFLLSGWNLHLTVWRESFKRLNVFADKGICINIHGL